MKKIKNRMSLLGYKLAQLNYIIAQLLAQNSLVESRPNKLFLLLLLLLLLLIIRYQSYMYASIMEKDLGKFIFDSSFLRNNCGFFFSKFKNTYICKPIFMS